MEFGLLIIIVILSSATVNTMILIAKGEKHLPNTLLLYISLFFYNFILLVYFTWFEAGYIVEFPHLLRTVSPLIYLCAPFFYFYIRNSVYNSVGLRKSDWIHFAPAFLHFLGLIPFFMEPYEVKLAYAQLLVSDPTLISQVASGLIPMSFHYLFRIFLQTSYFGYAIYLVYRVQPQIFSKLGIKGSVNWFPMVFLSLGWVVLFQLVYAVVEILRNLGLADYQGLSDMVRLMSLVGIFMLNVVINFWPRSVISDLPLELKKSGSSGFTGPKKEILNSNQEKFLKSVEEMSQDAPTVKKGSGSVRDKIINILEDEQIYTVKGMNLTHFSSRLGLPLKSVSQEINSEFGIGFNELLNQYRVKFAIEKIEKGYLDDFTLESLGELSGFNSRTTFFNAFKKEKGCSPSEYWKSFQSSLD